MRVTFSVIVTLLLIVCALAVERTRDLLAAVIIFAAYSLLMAINWQLLGAPDVAITEAAVGAGVTTLLLITAVRRTRRYEE
jgi:energy-converting hydrogenase B subunit D